MRGGRVIADRMMLMWLPLMSGMAAAGEAPLFHNDPVFEFGLSFSLAYVGVGLYFTILWWRLLTMEYNAANACGEGEEQ